MNNRNRYAAQKPQGHKPLLIIIETVVLEGEGGTFKDSWGIPEIQPVFAEVGLAFPFIPPEAHLRSVYTPRPRIKQSAAL